MKLPRFGKWTDTAVQLPGRDETVITLSVDGTVSSAAGSEIAADVRVAFWMPLPPPQELPPAQDLSPARSGLSNKNADE